VIRKDTNTIILDAYNANPTSMAAALKNFESLPGKPKIIFLGDMAELGHESSREHARMIELIKQVKADTVILVGKNFHPFIHGLSCHYFETSDAAATWTKSQHFKSATILIKGSRSVKMEKVMEGI
jgi:UDP-N-acetylmuramoyl-tripeptide--D-alanyl-D-alanine ligase